MFTIKFHTLTTSNCSIKIFSYLKITIPKILKILELKYNSSSKIVMFMVMSSLLGMAIQEWIPQPTNVGSLKYQLLSAPIAQIKSKI